MQEIHIIAEIKKSKGFSKSRGLWKKLLAPVRHVKHTQKCGTGQEPTDFQSRHQCYANASQIESWFLPVRNDGRQQRSSRTRGKTEKGEPIRANDKADGNKNPVVVLAKAACS